MPYEYRCAVCRSKSPRHDHRIDAEAEQDWHRGTVHGGLEPAAGDGVRPVHDESRGDGCLPSGSFLFFMFLLAAVLANCWGR